jgi:hypothetical protein
MIIVTVKPVKAELVDFSVKDENAEMNIWFSDGHKEHKLALNRKVVGAEELAEQMIVEMRKIAKSSHKKESDEYDEILVVNFENEDDAVKKLQRFFEKVREKVKEVKQLRSAQGYLDTINRVKKFEVDLT